MEQFGVVAGRSLEVVADDAAKALLVAGEHGYPPAFSASAAPRTAPVDSGRLASVGVAPGEVPKHRRPLQLPRVRVLALSATRRNAGPRDAVAERPSSAAHA